MALTALWTAHCDRCSYWGDEVIGDSFAEVRVQARRLGWVIPARRDQRRGNADVLCPRCRTPDTARDETGGEG